MLTESLRRAYGERTESLRKTSSYLSKPCFLFGHPRQQLTACLTQDCHGQFLAPAYGEPYGPLRQVLCLRRLTAHLTDPYGFPNGNTFSTMVLLTAAYGAPYGPLLFFQHRCVFNQGVAYGGLQHTLRTLTVFPTWIRFLCFRGGGLSI